MCTCIYVYLSRSECTDANVHAAWQKKQKKRTAAANSRAEAVQADEEVTNAAAWSLLGSTAEAAWLLTDKQL